MIVKMVAKLTNHVKFSHVFFWFTNGVINTIVISLELVKLKNA